MKEIDITLNIRTDESTRDILSDSYLIFIVKVLVLFTMMLGSSLYSIYKGLPTWVIIMLGLFTFFYGFICSRAMIIRKKRKEELNQFINNCLGGLS